MMAERPIIMSTPMVLAILQGKKTQTRRICRDNSEMVEAFFYVKDHPTTPEFWRRKKSEPYTGWVVKYNNLSLSLPRKCPYGDVGDVLWVRESGWVDNNYIPVLNEPHLFWKANYEDYQEWEKTLIKENTCRFSSIHMYKDFARIWLEITKIRVERLHDISEEDAKAEGVKENMCEDRSKCISTLCKTECAGTGEYYHYSNPMDFDLDPCYSAVESYKTLWKSINGDDSWETNPWVWVIEFKRIKH